MGNATPQEKVGIFLDVVGGRLGGAMPALVHPTPLNPLLGEVEGWLGIIGTSGNNETYQTVRAALLILGDDLEKAHGIVQNIETAYAAA